MIQKQVALKKLASIVTLLAFILNSTGSYAYAIGEGPVQSNTLSAYLASRLIDSKSNDAQEIARGVKPVNGLTIIDRADRLKQVFTRMYGDRYSGQVLARAVQAGIAERVSPAILSSEVSWGLTPEAEYLLRRNLINRSGSSASRNSPSATAQELQAAKLEALSQDIVTYEDPSTWVYFAWGLKGNDAILHRTPRLEQGERYIAQIWGGATEPRTNVPEGENAFALVTDTAVVGTDGPLPNATFNQFLDAHPEVIGEGMDRKRTFAKVMTPGFPPNIVYMGYSKKIEQAFPQKKGPPKTGKQVFADALKLDRELMVWIKDAMRTDLPSEEFARRFNEVFKPENKKWADAYTALGWEGDVPLPDIREIIDPQFHSELTAKFEEIRKVRAEIVSFMNVIQLKDGMVIIVPSDHLHGIHSLSIQIHPKPATNPLAKYEAWIARKVLDADGGEHMVLIEPQQMSDTTVSVWDYDSPIELGRDGKPKMRKDLWDKLEWVTPDRPATEAGAIDLIVDRVLPSKGFEKAEPFIVRDHRKTEYSGAHNVESRMLIEGTYGAIWPEDLLAAETIVLNGSANEEASIDLPGVGCGYDMLVFNGQATVQAPGKEAKTIQQGRFVFVPATIDGPVRISATEKTEIYRFWPGEMLRKSPTSMGPDRDSPTWSIMGDMAADIKQNRTEEHKIATVGITVVDLIINMRWEEAKKKIPGLTMESLEVEGDIPGSIDPSGRSIENFLAWYKEAYPAEYRRLMRTVIGGGPAYSTARAFGQLTKLGRSIAKFASRAHHDSTFYGVLSADLEDANVGVSADAIFHSELPTAKTVIFEHGSGKRSFLHNVGASAGLDIEQFELQVKSGLFDDVEVIEFGGLELSGLMKDLDKAIQLLRGREAFIRKERGVAKRFTIVLDTVVDPAHTWKKFKRSGYTIFKEIDIFITNMGEGGQIYGDSKSSRADRAKKAAEKANYRDLIVFFHSKGAKAVFLKMGAAGSVVSTKKDSVFGEKAYAHIPSMRGVKEVSGTGTGDIFSAAAMYGEAFGWDPIKTALFATAAAAVCLEERGGTLGDRGFDDVRARAEALASQLDVQESLAGKVTVAQSVHYAQLGAKLKDLNDAKRDLRRIERDLRYASADPEQDGKELAELADKTRPAIYKLGREVDALKAKVRAPEKYAAGGILDYVSSRAIRQSPSSQAGTTDYSPLPGRFNEKYAAGRRSPTGDPFGFEGLSEPEEGDPVLYKWSPAPEEAPEGIQHWEAVRGLWNETIEPVWGETLTAEIWIELKAYTDSLHGQDEIWTERTPANHAWDILRRGIVNAARNRHPDLWEESGAIMESAIDEQMLYSAIYAKRSEESDRALEEGRAVVRKELERNGASNTLELAVILSAIAHTARYEMWAVNVSRGMLRGDPNCFVYPFSNCAGMLDLVDEKETRDPWITIDTVMTTYRDELVERGIMTEAEADTVTIGIVPDIAMEEGVDIEGERPRLKVRWSTYLACVKEGNADTLLDMICSHARSWKNGELRRSPAGADVDRESPSGAEPRQSVRRSPTAQATLMPEVAAQTLTGTAGLVQDVTNAMMLRLAARRAGVVDVPSELSNVAIVMNDNLLKLDGLGARGAVLALKYNRLRSMISRMFADGRGVKSVRTREGLLDAANMLRHEGYKVVVLDDGSLTDGLNPKAINGTAGRDWCAVNAEALTDIDIDLEIPYVNLFAMAMIGVAKLTDPHCDSRLFELAYKAVRGEAPSDDDIRNFRAQDRWAINVLPRPVPYSGDARRQDRELAMLFDFSV